MISMEDMWDFHGFHKQQLGVILEFNWWRSDFRLISAWFHGDRSQIMGFSWDFHGIFHKKNHPAMGVPPLWKAPYDVQTLGAEVPKALEALWPHGLCAVLAMCLGVPSDGSWRVWVWRFTLWETYEKLWNITSPFLMGKSTTNGQFTGNRLWYTIWRDMVIDGNWFIGTMIHHLKGYLEDP